MQNKERDMFGKSNGKLTDETNDPVPVQQMQRLAAASSAAPAGELAETVSCISSVMTVVGKLAGEGTVKIYGRVEGEIKATSVVVFDGGEVVGDIIAEDVTIGGHVNGTIRGDRVKLIGTAVVEGDIFHRSLVIEEKARFEGSSRREDTAQKPIAIALSRPQPPTTAVAVADHKLNGQSDEAHASSAAG
jgi:cytoskeletal protein CcmA (bactofilin family)